MPQIIILPHAERCPEGAVLEANTGDILIEVALDAGISIEAIRQQTHVSSQVPVIILTRPVAEGHMNDAIKAIEALQDVSGEVARIRVENLDG